MREIYIARIKHDFYDRYQFFDDDLVVNDSMVGLDQELFRALNNQMQSIYEEIPWNDLKYAFDTLDKIIELGVKTKWFSVEFSKKPPLKVGDLVMVSDDFHHQIEGCYPQIEPVVGDIGLITSMDDAAWPRIIFAKGETTVPIVCLSKHQPTEKL